MQTIEFIGIRGGHGATAVALAAAATLATRGPTRISTHDRRALRIRLTRKGKQVAKQVFDQHGRWIAGLFGNLSMSERKQLAAILDKVAANLGNTEKGSLP